MSPFTHRDRSLLHKRPGEAETTQGALKDRYLHSLKVSPFKYFPVTVVALIRIHRLFESPSSGRGTRLPWPECGRGSVSQPDLQSLGWGSSNWPAENTTASTDHVLRADATSSVTL